MSETITEDIVRDHFINDKDSEKITVVRHGSTNPRIKKLLKNASKSGNGAGYPDITIEFKDYPDYIILVECKADRIKHESKYMDNCKDYAIDGVLLYSSYVSQEFNVLSIAVSGEDVNNLKVSHFLQLKGEKSNLVFGGKLLQIKDYLNKLMGEGNNLLFKEQYDELLTYSTKLNNELHSLKVKESQRSLLISGILIALKEDDFRKGYKNINNPSKLANRLVEEIEIQLKEALPKIKAKNVAVAYSFIQTHPALSGDKDILKNLIRDIDEKIYTFLEKYPGNDVLGQFYIEFLQYSNNDKALGIVLTPPHITELFSDLAMVNKDSIILDTCTGTGGFLISGMKKMIEDAKGDQEKEKYIKRHQIIGIEYQDDIFALACSNMYIHGDGRSNIRHGSCFDNEIIKEVKELKPTVGFLNPPYKTEKTDKHELEFILNNLYMLEKGGICVAIVPMSCALSQSGKELELKKQIMEQHTLEAVFSMPDELFFNSNVGTVTCIMVIKAHQPHPNNYETYFGYCKNDGFTKQKTKGRQDYSGKWESIRNQWISNFYNKKEILGFSVKKYVNAEDEWCAEAYMETDYSKINKEDFIRIIRDFVIFKEMNQNG